MIETFEERGGFLKPIISPIIAIGQGFLYLEEFCMTLLEVFVNVMELIPNVFSPDKLINDVIYGVTEGIKTMISTFFGGLISNSFNISLGVNKPTLTYGLSAE